MSSAASSRPRVVFMGTPDLARTVLRSLLRAGLWDLPLVVAQPDKPVGRGLQLQAPPVKEEALAHGLQVLQPIRARDPVFLDQVRSFRPDVVVVAAYGQILPPELLAVPRHGCLNVHTSILPRWRGAAPIQWAILEGDTETGVTLMRMDAGLDTGDVLGVERTPLAADETGRTLHDRLAAMGGDFLVRLLPDWLEGRLQPVPQPKEAGVTYARKLRREDGRLDWLSPAAVLDRRVRAFDPWPGAFTHLPAESSGTPPPQLKIWESRPVAWSGPALPGTVLEARGEDLVVATGEGGLRIVSLQREGRRRMSAREFLAGGGLPVGSRLGAEPESV